MITLTRRLLYLEFQAYAKPPIELQCSGDATSKTLDNQALVNTGA